MKVYFVHDGRRQAGPYSLEELRKKNLRLDTPVWRQGLPQWVNAGNLVEIQSILPKSPSVLGPGKRS